MPTIADYLKYANLQMAAEAFLKNPVTDEEYYSGIAMINALKEGNGHASRFTESEATKFEKDWIVLDQCKNTDTGFSGTLFRSNVNPNEYVLGIRSTEFIDDAIRDSASTNTQEVHDTGWAWGQISDMEAWYAQLKENGLIPASAQLNVTGYSLGGHLATAFNLLHQSELNGGQVITFNGAGVGEIKSGTLADNLAYFNSLRTSETARESALNLQEQESIDYYKDLVQNLNNTWTAQDALTALQAVKTNLLTVRPDIVAQELVPLEKALAAIIDLQTEAARIQGFTSGAYGSTPDTPIKNVPAEQIEAQTLAYRLAVYFAGQRTEGANLLTDIGHITSKTIVNPLANQFDLVGIESSGNMTWSAVANSQIHHGNDAGIFIEDQPFTRGGFTSGLAQGLLTGQIHLLQDKHLLNNFADTHSLILIVDSLNVQNAKLEWNETDSPHQAAEAGIPFRFNPADRVGQEKPGSDFCNVLISNNRRQRRWQKPLRGAARSSSPGVGLYCIQLNL